MRYRDRRSKKEKRQKLADLKIGKRRKGRGKGEIDGRKYE